MVWKKKLKIKGSLTCEKISLWAKLVVHMFVVGRQNYKSAMTIIL